MRFLDRLVTFIAIAGWLAACDPEAQDDERSDVSSTSAALCRASVPRSEIFSDVYPIGYTSGSLHRSAGDIRSTQGVACGRASGLCVQFVPPGRTDYDVGRRVQGELVYGPVAVPADARLAVAATLQTENHPYFDLATVAIRCASEVSWREIHRVGTSCPGMDTHVIDIPAGDRGRACSFRIAFDSVDAAYNRFAGLVVRAIGFERGSASDPDADGIATRSDNCPLVWDPSQLDSDLDGRGDVCDVEPYLPLRRGVIGVAFRDETPGSTLLREAVGLEVGSLPPGLRVEWGVIVGTPTVAGDFTVKVREYDASGRTLRQRVFALYVFPELTQRQRVLLAAAALVPVDLAGDVYLGTVTRLDHHPTFFFDAAAHAADGTLKPGARYVADLLREAVPIMSGGKLTAKFGAGGPFEWPSVNIAFSGAPTGARSVSEPVTISVPFRGNGRVTGGFVALPAVWADAFPTWGIPGEARPDATAIETVRHELAHVFHGPHTWVAGNGLIQQRDRMVREFTDDERLIYRILYRLPIGTSATALVSDGLLRAEDLRPQAVIDRVRRILDPSASWPEDSIPPEGARPGHRLKIHGGNFEYYWSCSTDDGRVHAARDMAVEFAGVAAATPIAASTMVGQPCTQVDVIVPPGAVSGEIRVIARSPDGTVLRRSAPHVLTIAP